MLASVILCSQMKKLGPRDTKQPASVTWPVVGREQFRLRLSETKARACNHHTMGRVVQARDRLSVRSDLVFQVPSDHPPDSPELRAM